MASPTAVGGAGAALPLSAPATGGGGGGGGGGWSHDDEDDDGHGRALAAYEDDEDDEYLAGAGAAGHDDDDAGKNFMVVIRVRPPLPREITSSFQNVVRVDASAQQIIISENLAALDEGGAAAAGPYATHMFAFDHVYGPECDQKVVYETTAMKVVESSLKGYNATIFAVRGALRRWRPACARGCAMVVRGGAGINLPHARLLRQLAAPQRIVAGASSPAGASRPARAAVTGGLLRRRWRAAPASRVHR
jgi:hypothetical protein